MGERGTGAMVGEAARDLRDQLADAAPDEVQLEMLGFVDPRDVAPDSQGSYAQAIAVWRANGCKGRKPGAMNRANADLRDYLLSFGTHPLVAMMVLQSRPAQLLAAELGCKPIEAAELQHKARAEIAPYIEGKKPVAVEFRGNAAMYVIPGMPDLDGNIVAVPIGGAVAAAPGAADEGTFECFPVDRRETAQNQGFSDADGERSE